VFGPRILPVTKTFDWRSALLSATMFGALFLTASDVVQNVLQVRFLFTALVGVVAGIWLVRRAWGKARPFVPLDLIRIPRIRLAYGASICGFGAQMCLLVSLPFELENRMGLPVAAVGLLFLPMPVTIGLISPVAGRLADKSWAGIMSAAGLCLLGAVLALMAASLRFSPPPAAIAVGMALCGVGFGLFQVPNNNVMLRAGPLDRAGAAAGMQAQCRLLGQTGGALIAALSLRLGGLGPEGALYIAAVLALCAAAFARSR
jgi:DHA2 family multidrug resistance protein-like MFS transporter